MCGRCTSSVGVEQPLPLIIVVLLGGGAERLHPGPTLCTDHAEATRVSAETRYMYLNNIYIIVPLKTLNFYGVGVGGEISYSSAYHLLLRSLGIL